MRVSETFSFKGIPLNRLTSEFGRVAYLNSNDQGRSLLALGQIETLEVEVNAQGDVFETLRGFLEDSKDWIFGYLTYELKDRIYPHLSSLNPDPMGWPQLAFFQPEIVVILEGSLATVLFWPARTGEDRLSLVKDCLQTTDYDADFQESVFEHLVSKQSYVDTIRAIQDEIQWGNIYELNYCIPFDRFAANLNTGALYSRLNDLTKAPFSVYYHDAEYALMCASPERFLQKRGRKLLAQPIKGTIRRGKGEEDERMREALRTDPKERAENIMITDLVRNDLSKVADSESVRVEELCEIYSFKTVHQMISSISADLRSNCDAVDALSAAFPMGSMTGAPKVSAMQFIEKFEIRRRGLYSGAFGYFSPDGDFDFNVVIRSLMYRKSTGLVTFEVGSAITGLSDPEREYEECLLKADALLTASKNPRHVV